MENQRKFQGPPVHRQWPSNKREEPSTSKPSFSNSRTRTYYSSVRPGAGPPAYWSSNKDDESPRRTCYPSVVRSGPPAYWSPNKEEGTPRRTCYPSVIRSGPPTYWSSNKEEGSPRRTYYPSVRPGPPALGAPSKREEHPRGHYYPSVRPGPPAHWAYNKGEESPRSPSPSPPSPSTSTSPSPSPSSPSSSPPSSPGPSPTSSEIYKYMQSIKSDPVDPDDPAIIKKKSKPKPRRMWERPPPQDPSNFKSYHNDYEIDQREKEIKLREISNKLKDLLGISRVAHVFGCEEANKSESESDDDVESILDPDYKDELCKKLSEDLRQALKIGAEEVCDPELPVFDKEEEEEKTQSDAEKEKQTGNEKCKIRFFIHDKYRYSNDDHTDHNKYL